MERVPLKHTDGATDEQLAQEAKDYYMAHPPVELVSDLISGLAVLECPWWTSEMLFEQISLGNWMLAIESRPDLRQQITTDLTGLRERTARRMTPESQTTLIEEALESGDIALDDVHEMLAGLKLVAYLDAGRLWRLFRERMPWVEDAVEKHIDIVASLLEDLLQPRGDLPQILPPLEVLSHIDSNVWEDCIPLEVRARVRKARMLAEASGDTFHSINELGIATPEIIANSIPLVRFEQLLDRAEEAMGFAPPAPPEEEEDKDDTDEEDGGTVVVDTDADVNIEELDGMKTVQPPPLDADVTERPSDSDTPATPDVDDVEIPGPPDLPKLEGSTLTGPVVEGLPPSSDVSPPPASMSGSGIGDMRALIELNDDFGFELPTEDSALPAGLAMGLRGFVDSDASAEDIDKALSRCRTALRLPNADWKKIAANLHQRGWSAAATKVFDRASKAASSAPPKGPPRPKKRRGGALVGKPK